MDTRKKDTDAAALASFDTLPDAAFVRVKTVAALLSVTPCCVWKWAREGRIPAPKRLGPQVTAWSVGDLRRARASKTEAA
mgnify:CR=1 FL=1